jgi:hypothetical protein
MPFTLRPYYVLLALTNIVCILVQYLPPLVQAETKTIVSEPTYTMGDGETLSLAEAQTSIEAWRLDDHHRRPHRSLGHLTPNECVGQRHARQTAEEVIGSR